MRRNGHAVPPVAPSFEELKLKRPAASNQGDNTVTVCNSEASNSFPLTLETDGGRSDNLLHGSDQTSRGGVAIPSIVANNTPLVAAHSSSHHRYELKQQLPLQHGRSRRNSSGLGKSREPSTSSFETAIPLGDAVQQAPLLHTTASDTDDARYPQAGLPPSPPHTTTGVPAPALSSSASAIDAGARAANAAVPFLFSLKLPSTTVTHLGVGRASGAGVAQSCDSLNGSMSSALGGSLLQSRNRITGMGEAAADSGTSSPWRVNETTGAGVDSDHHSHHCQLQPGSGEVNTTATTLFPRDVGPLPASEAYTRNRLPSGTHIRRRPRSVVRQYTGVAGMASIRNGASPTKMAGDVESASPAYGTLDASVSSVITLASPHMRQRGTSATFLNSSVSGSGTVTRAGTGRTRDVLPPGTRSSTVIGAAAGAVRRHRADPSPAPSRPPRSRRARPGAAPGTLSGGPSSAAVSGPTFSPSSPAQLGSRVSHQPSVSLQVPKRLLLEHSSTGASSPLNGSLEHGSFLLAGDKDSLAASTSAVANHEHPISSCYTNKRSGRSRVHSAGTTVVTPSTKPPSGRRQGSLARVLAPMHHSSSASRLEEHCPSSPLQDYAKLAATYMKLCADVGDEPNMDWVAALPLMKGEESQYDILPASMTLSTADAKELSTNHSQRAPGLLNGSPAVSGHFLRSGPQQLQQQHTPRGGVRPRIAAGATWSSLSATMTPVDISAPTSTSFVSQRASTPAGKRAKSPGVRHGASSASSPSTLPKRSGSVGRITSVSRPSIFGSSTQQLQHTITGGKRTPRTHRDGSATSAVSPGGVETAMTDVYAHKIARYCAEYLQPFVDNMKSVQEQRAAVTVALQSFVQVARTSLSASAAAVNTAVTAEKSDGEEAGLRSAVSVHGHHYGGHSNRGLGSDRGGPTSGTIPSTTTSSTSTTPRKFSISRNSTTSSLANTTTTTTAGHMCRRASAAAAAASKAASLSDALQTLQAAVVTLLSTLSDGTALAQAPRNELLSPVKNVDKGSAPLDSQPTLMEAGIITTVTSCSLFSPDESASGRFDKAPAAPQLVSSALTPTIDLATSPTPSLAHTSSGDGGSSGLPGAPRLTLANAMTPSGVGVDQLAPPLPGVTGVGSGHTSQSQTSAVGSSATTAAASSADSTTSNGTAPSRFVQFVCAQKREVMAQLDELCGAVRDALGLPVTAPEAATTQRSTENSVGGAPSVPVVWLEVPDMLSTPFFVPLKHLNNLLISMTRQSGDDATTEEDAAATTSSDAIVTSPTTATFLKSSNISSSPKFSSNATGNKAKSSKVSSGGGSITGHSSASSTPRTRANMTIMPYAPLFTFTTTADEDVVADGAAGEDPQVRSVSARSTEGASGNAYTAVECYLLRCMQPSAGAGTAVYSTLLGTGSGRTSSRQNSALNWTTTDLSASVESTHGGGAATAKVSTMCKTGSKRSTSPGASYSGRAGGAGGGWGSVYQSRPSLSTSQKAPATTKASASPRKSRKKASVVSKLSQTQKGLTQQEKNEQQHQQQQRQLAKAWTLWLSLKPLAASQNGVASAGAQEPPLPSPHPSPVVGGSLSDCTPTEENEAATPPAMSAPTAAATPAAATRKEASPNSKGGPVFECQLPLEADDEEAAPVTHELQSPPPQQQQPGVLDGLRSHNDGSHLCSAEEKDNGDVLHSELSDMRVHAAGSMPRLLSLQSVPQRLNMDGAALTHSDGAAHSTPSAQSSAATLVYSFSMAMSQPTAPLPNSASCVEGSSPVSTNAMAPAHAVAADTHKAAARQIAVWWASLHCRRRAVAQHRGAHLTENVTQRERVLAARRNAFVRLWVFRWRLRRRIEEHQQQQQVVASAAATVAKRAEHDDSEKVRRTAAEMDKVEASPTTTTTTTAPTSRERFQRAKEQRKVALASAAAATSGTARVSSSPSTVNSGTMGTASCLPIRIPPLPLAASGISTFAIRNYQGESSSFAVSAMHRLLNAPPPLLYATCTVALRYPTNAPMAYLDNSSSGSAANRHLNDGEERQKCEAPPATNEHGGDALTAQQRRWIEEGVLYTRLLNLRHYVCGKYEAIITVSDRRGSVDEFPSSSSGCYALSSFDDTLNSAARAYRGTSCPRATSALLVPPTMRYESVVDPKELKHAKPVVKAFHRPFEKWGMACNLTSRVFCAAAIYAWQLIFSHTPFDDAKQRELPTREEQQARLERVEDRNSIILDCYGVRSEREWLREATKDLSFVSQIYLPNYDQDDPEQERESRDSYEFVKNFLFQCFPCIHKLADIPDYLVGSGLFFLLKEVFHYTKDSPSMQQVYETLPRLVVVEGEDHIAAVTPATSALACDDAAAARAERNAATEAALGLPAQATTQCSSLPSCKVTDSGDGVKGLSGWQRAALQRYEQLRQLHHLTYGIVEQEKAVAALGSDAGASGLPDKMKQSKQHHQQKRSRSLATSTASIGGAAKDSVKAASGYSGEDSSNLTSSASPKTAVDDIIFPLRRCITNNPAGPLTLMRSTPVSAALSSSAFTSPCAVERRASSAAIAAPARDVCVQLVRVPRRLLRPSAADAQFVRDFEEEVSKSVHAIIRAWRGSGGGTSLNVFDLRAALTADAALHDALDIVYPKHFLVKLSETLSLELFGLQVSLSSCEDLDSMGQ
nr:unnamed protein product [Leishmania braziliensis]